MKQSSLYLSLMALLFAFGITLSSCESSYSDTDGDVTFESTDPEAEETAEGNTTSHHQSSENQEVPPTMNNDTTVQEYTDDESSKAYSTTRPNKRDSLREQRKQ